MNIIEIAHKAGLWYSESTFVWTSPTEGNQYPEGIYQEALERFAALVAAASASEEREACAIVASEYDQHAIAPAAIAAAIRARGRE